MKVFNAITQLLQFKGFCNYSEVSQVSGLKKLDVLEILNLNKRFLEFHPNKSDRIVGLTNSVIISDFISKGKVYWLEKENYGCIEVICFKGNEELQKKLEKPYVCGGLGDCYTIKCIENIRENLDAVQNAGMRELDWTRKQEPVVKYWEEKN